MKSFRFIALVALSAAVAASPGTAPAAENQPPKPSPSVEEEEEEGKGEKEEDFKEEPTTKEGKAREEEIKKKACPSATPGFDHESEKNPATAREPMPDKGIVYVVRPSRLGSKIQSKFAADGAWAGVNRGRSSFVLEMAPGEHFFCSKAENTSVLALNVEAGKIYFVEQKIKMGFMKARNQLALLTEKEGREKLGKTKPSIWKQKK